MIAALASLSLRLRESDACGLLVDSGSESGVTVKHVMKENTICGVGPDDMETIRAAASNSLERGVTVVIP